MARYLIVGGVAGGMSAAARLRRMDEHAEIIVFERGKYISYANCGLPYYIGNVIQERQKLLVLTSEEFRNRFNVEVRTETEVVSIQRKEKAITVKNLKTGEESVEKYDKLILSPGAEPVRPPIPGINHPEIYTLRNIPDTDILKKRITENKPRRALIVGAGFIGLEMAENLHHQGIFVTIVELGNQVMNVIDYDLAAEVHQHLKTKGVEFYLSDGVSSFEDAEGHVKVKLTSGRELVVDMVVLSIGVKPDSSLAKAIGLDLSERGGIAVDTYMQTSDENIYAIGDAVECINPLTGKRGLVPLAWPANYQGRMVADNVVLGNKRQYKGTYGTAIAKVFDLAVAVTGATEKLLKRENIKYQSITIHASDHAGYYPNALPMSVKIQFNPTDGRLFGAEIVGYQGVDKRIDVFAVAVQKSMTVYELAELEHAYAPPFSSAKDVTNLVGYVAENILTGRLKVINWDEVRELDRKDTVFVDVRTSEETLIGKIEGSINIPVDDLRDRLNEIPKDKKIVVYCGVGLRGYVATRILMQNGFTDVYNLNGGYKTFEIATQKQSNGDIFEGYHIGLNDMLTTKPEVSSINLKVKSESILAVDACGLQCPGPIMKVKEAMDQVPFGGEVAIKASDPGFYNDIAAWAKSTGNKLLDVRSDKGIISARLQKQGTAAAPTTLASGTKDVTMIVFDADLDKAIATFIVANGALSMGRKVTLFFTFWGLNVLRKDRQPKVKKTFIEKMFGWMMPRGTHKLPLSRMNMAGIGPKMIRGIMKKHNIDSVEEMMDTALKNGVKIVACQMSMDLLGMKKEELIDGIEIGGVASYLSSAGEANTNLFI